MPADGRAERLWPRTVTRRWLIAARPPAAAMTLSGTSIFVARPLSSTSMCVCMWPPPRGASPYRVWSDPVNVVGALGHGEIARRLHLCSEQHAGEDEDEDGSRRGKQRGFRLSF